MIELYPEDFAIDRKQPMSAETFEKRIRQLRRKNTETVCKDGGLAGDYEVEELNYIKFSRDLIKFARSLNEVL